MGLELARQGRHEEAVHWATQAADGFRKLEKPQDLFIALRNLSRHLADSGHHVEAGQVFEEAHDLIHKLRREQLDEAHYAAYPARVARIEEHSAERLSWLEVGGHALLAETAYEQGMQQLEEGRFAEAIESLKSSRDHWLPLQAWHRLVRVDHHLALAYIELGATHDALPVAAQARALARDLGDAFGESMAITGLFRLRHLLRGQDELDLLAQAHALDALLGKQLGDGVDPGGIDGGVLSGLAATLCADSYAFELAQRYMNESLAAGRKLPDSSAHRLAGRLHNFHRMLLNAGDQEHATQARDELRELVASKLNDDPRGALILARVQSRQAFYDGDRSMETLAGLLQECRAYEELRRQTKGAPLTGFSETVDPPFEEAAEVALALNRPALALQLLQLGKARTLLEALNVAVPTLPEAAGPDPTPPELGDAVGLELFVTRSAIVVFVLDGASGQLRWITVPEEQQADHRLGRLVRRLTDAADSERGTGRGVDTALDTVMRHPTFAKLCETLLSTAGDGRPVWVAPHRFLHQAPLQLAPTVTGVGRLAPWSLVPALPLVNALPASRSRPSRVTFTVCGDPDGSLPFARAEARLVAGERGHLALGDESDAAWLQEHTGRDDIAVLHIACHGRFDRGRPTRSGLLLAAAEGQHLVGTSVGQLFTVDSVAQLHLDGVVVTLSACSTGLEAVREGDESTGLVSALLQAGATAIIAAQWPISDLSAMLLMVEFHDALSIRPDVAELGSLLNAAAERLGTMTVDELIDRGFELAQRIKKLHGSNDEAVTVAAGCLHRALLASGDDASAAIVEQIAYPRQPTVTNGTVDRLAALEALRPARGERSNIPPFSRPEHWGAFTVIGRGNVV